MSPAVGMQPHDRAPERSKRDGTTEPPMRRRMYSVKKRQRRPSLPAGCVHPLPEHPQLPPLASPTTSSSPPAPPSECASPPSTSPSNTHRQHSITLTSTKSTARQSPWTPAGSARNREIRLRLIDMRRMHRYSPRPELCEAESGRVFWRTPQKLWGPILAPLSDLMGEVGPSMQPTHAVFPKLAFRSSVQILRPTREFHLCASSIARPPFSTRPSARTR